MINCTSYTSTLKIHRLFIGASICVVPEPDRPKGCDH